MYHQIHTYTELRQQIHDDLRVQHPEWVLKLVELFLFCLGITYLGAWAFVTARAK
jgi:hypothetical protein